jgi:hypothetical protein
MATKKTKLPGRASMFRGKIRAPVSVTLTPAHHLKARQSMKRLGLTRSDLIGLLIDKYANTVTTTFADAYKCLREAVDALGGTLEHRKPNEPRGGTWVLKLGGKRLKMLSEQSKRYPLLDACYELKDGAAVSGTWEDYTHDINPSGVAQLFTSLASSEDSGAE